MLTIYSNLLANVECQGMYTSFCSTVIMAARVFFLTLCVLLASVGSESGQQLSILHFYLEAGIFNYVELVCVVVSESSSVVIAGATFQVSGTDIEENDEIVQNMDNGTAQLLLTQEN